jgi:UDP-2,3-diacylglucosamine hydrolase
MVDGETLSIDALDYDLGRTFHRWPMERVQRGAYLAGYSDRRRPASFVRHFPFWTIMVLIDSALFRYRRDTRDAAFPIQRLHDLVADTARMPFSDLSGVSLAARRDGKSVFFVSDFHLGLAGRLSSIDREKQIVSWLESIEDEASDIFILGDMFDVWFEYRTVVPKGFVRLLGKLASLVDRGIQIHLFAGNHERWGVGYLREQLGAIVYLEPQIMELKGKLFYLGHGDTHTGAKPDAGARLATDSLARLAGRWLHPDLALPLASSLTRWKRALKRRRPAVTGDRNPDETLLRRARPIAEARRDLDYLVFGHRHLPAVLQVTDKTSCVDVGDWLTHASYAVFDGERMELKFYA